MTRGDRKVGVTIETVTVSEFLLLSGNPSRKRQVRLFIKGNFKLTVYSVVFGGSALFKGKHS